MPDEFVVVRGGVKPVPPPGTVFSAVAGPTLEAAASAVPYNQIRRTTAGEIRRWGGSVVWLAENSPHGTLNEQHVDVIEQGATNFSEPFPNPVPKKSRIDEGK